MSQSSDDDIKRLFSHLGLPPQEYCEVRPVTVRGNPQFVMPSTPIPPPATAARYQDRVNSQLISSAPAEESAAQPRQISPEPKAESLQALFQSIKAPETEANLNSGQDLLPDVKLAEITRSIPPPSFARNASTHKLQVTARVASEVKLALQGANSAVGDQIYLKDLFARLERGK